MFLLVEKWRSRRVACEEDRVTGERVNEFTSRRVDKGTLESRQAAGLCIL